MGANEKAISEVTRPRKRQTRFADYSLDTPPPLWKYRLMLGETQKQFFLTRAIPFQ
jgi:hypothetical protein